MVIVAFLLLGVATDKRIVEMGEMKRTANVSTVYPLHKNPIRISIGNWSKFQLEFKFSN